jgi:hypothetical protein
MLFWLAAPWFSGCGDDGPSEPAGRFRGEAVDPEGDGGVADLVFASLEVVGSSIRVRAEFTHHE